MTYTLSATKLQTYRRCPRAYYLHYEYGLKAAGGFGHTALGNALHQALAQIYGDWHYQEPLPPLSWIECCWRRQCNSLDSQQLEEGWRILSHYYHSFIVPQQTLHRPIAVEGRIRGQLQAEGVEFRLSGRYDRLDALEEGLELVDYKSSRHPKRPDPNLIDLQMGLYYLALEQRYRQCLKRISLLYLRTGEKLSFDVSLSHKQRVEAAIGELALQLRVDELWEPSPGEHCNCCSYTHYCPAIQDSPEPLPQMTRSLRQIQLALSF